MRFYLNPDTTFCAGQYTVTVEPDTFGDSLSATPSNVGDTYNFTVYNVTAQVVGPFVTAAPPGGGNPSTDVGAANAATFNVPSGYTEADTKLPYIDVMYNPAPGAQLDYDSILGTQNDVNMVPTTRTFTTTVPFTVSFTPEGSTKATTLTVDPEPIPITVSPTFGAFQGSNQVMLTFTPANTSSGTPATITQTGGSWTSEGFDAGDQITVSGTASNDNTYTIGSISADGSTLTLVARSILMLETKGAGVSVDTVSATPVPGKLQDKLPDDATLLGDQVDEFRYVIIPTTGDFPYTPGTLSVNFTGPGTGDWMDSQGDQGQASIKPLTFLIEGPTPTVANPSAGASIDVSALNNRHEIEVTLPIPADLQVAGYTIDPSSVTTLTPKFTLSGPGVGTAAVDTSQAPVAVPSMANTYSFWIDGTFATPTGGSQSDWVNINFIPGSYSFLPPSDTSYSPAPVSRAALSTSGVLTVTLPSPPGTFVGNSTDTLTFTPATSTSAATITLNGGGTWTDDGFIASDGISVSGTPNAANDGTYVVASINGATLTLASASVLVEQSTDPGVTVVTLSPAGSFVGSSTDTLTFNPATGTSAATITQSGCGTWTSEGFAAGDQITVSSTTGGPDEGTYLIDSIDTTGTILKVTAVSTLVSQVDVSADVSDTTRTAGNGTNSLTFTPAANGNQATITQSGGGNWSSEGFELGDQITVSGTPDQANDGTYTISAIDSTGTILSVTAVSTFVSQSGVSDVAVITPATTGVAIDPNSVIRNFQNSTAAMPLFTVSGAETSTDAPVTVSLNTAMAPTLTSTANTFNFPVTLSNTIPMPEKVMVMFTTSPWSYTDPGDTYPSSRLSSSMTAAANNKSYLDVTFQPANNEKLDTSAIAGQPAPFKLSESGVTVSGNPIQLGGTSSTGAVTFRYFFTGAFTPGLVTVTFMGGTVFDTADTQGAAENTNLASAATFTVTGPTVDLVNPGDSGAIGQTVINDRGFIDVPFNVPAGATLAPASIIGDATPPFTLGGTDAAAGRLAIDTSQPPVFMGQSGSTYVFRYWTLGTLTTDDVSVTFATGSYSYTDADGSTGTSADATATPVTGNGSITIDVPFTVPPGASLSSTQMNSITGATTLPFMLGGTDAGAGRLLIDTNESPTFVAQTGSTYVFAYTALGSITTYDVTAIFAAGAYSYTNADGSTKPSAAATVMPQVNAVYTMASTTVPTPETGYLDVRFTPTTGDQINYAALTGGTAAPFTLAGTGLGTIALVPFSTLAPTLMAINVVRFYVTGAYVPGPVTLSFAAGSFQSVTAFGADNENLAMTVTFSVQQLTATLVDPTPGTTADPDTLNNRGYIDVTFTLPPYASSLDLTSIESLTPKFTVTVDNPSDGTLTLDNTQPAIPVGQSGNTYTFRFWYTGTFQSGELTLNFIGDSFNYLDSTGQPIPDFADETLPVQQGTASDGSTYFYVDVPFGTSQALNGNSIASNAFSVTAITSGTTTTPTTSVNVALQPSTKTNPNPITIGVYQFDLSGGSLAAGDAVTIALNAGNWSYGNYPSSLTLPSQTPMTIMPGQSRSYIDVNDPLIGGSPLNPATINGGQFTLSGAGASGVTIDNDPRLIASSSMSATYRYFFTGSFQPGPVTVQFNAGSWADMAGDVGTASTESFQVISQVQPPVAGATNQQVFFISISGQLLLNDAGLTSQPLIDMTGNVTITISPEPNFTLSATGTVDVYKVGNVASGAAYFVLNTGNGLSTPELYGVLKLDTNFGFLIPYGITAQATAVLEVNTTPEVQTVKIALAGIPGDQLFTDMNTSDVASLPQSIGSSASFNSSIAAGLLSLFESNNIVLDDSMTNTNDPPPTVTAESDPVTGNDMWIISAVINGVTSQYFIRDIPADPTTGAAAFLQIDSETQTFSLRPETFLLQISGQLTLKEGGSTYFSLRGAISVEITNTDFQFFALAALDLSGSSIAKVALIAVNPALAAVNFVDVTALFDIEYGATNPGVAGYLNINLSLGTGDLSSGLNGVSPNVNFTGMFRLMFNTTATQIVYTIPSQFLSLLSPTQPTTITIPATPPPAPLFTLTEASAKFPDTNSLPTGSTATSVPGDWLAYFAQDGDVTLSSSATVVLTSVDNMGYAYSWTVTDGSYFYTITKQYADPNNSDTNDDLVVQKYYGAISLFKLTEPDSTFSDASTLPQEMGSAVAVPSNWQMFFSTKAKVGLSPSATVVLTSFDNMNNPYSWTITDGTNVYFITKQYADPNISGSENELVVQKQGATPTAYIQLQIQGNLDLFNQITLVGSFTITASASVSGSYVTTTLNILGGVSAKVSLLGTLSGNIDFTAQISTDPSMATGFWGSAS